MEAYKLVMVQFQTPLHIRIHPLIIWSMFLKLQKVSEQIEIDESLWWCSNYNCFDIKLKNQNLMTN
jgi:hypothetical protein